MVPHARKGFFCAISFRGGLRRLQAEIIAVGTELLLGQIVNTNAQFLSRRLADAGIDVYFQTVVGDNLDRIVRAFEIAVGRADLVICSGGLGPTQDDVTKQALAKFTGRKLYHDGEALANIRRFFKERGTPMTDNNARQALALEGGDILPNDVGLAIGAAVMHNGKGFLLLPGPPAELRAMFTGYALPWIRRQWPEKEPLFTKLLKFGGIGESALEERLLDLIEAQEQVTIAPYAGEGEVTIRLAVKARSRREAEERMRAVEEEIRRRAGRYLFADRDIHLEDAVFELLKTKGRTVATAESCTGGLLAERLTSLPGSSAVFAGGVVTYTNAMKHRMLGIPMDLLEGPGAPGAVSPETARLMAERVLELTGSDYALSITGVAGPDPSEGKPVGLVHIGLAGRQTETDVFTIRAGSHRETVRRRAVRNALFRLWQKLAET